jgi:hypothetical protein
VKLVDISVFTEGRGLRFDHPPQINWRGMQIREYLRRCYYLDGFRKGAVVAHRERISGYLCRPRGGNAKPFLRCKGVCRAKG